MEDNLADALKIAAFMLIFMLALSITVSSFSKIRQLTEAIVVMSDREYETTYVNLTDVGTLRKVSAETMVPTIMRAYTERYRIIFMDYPELYYEQEYDEQGYEIDENGNRVKGSPTPRNYIDIEDENIGSDEEKLFFIIGILYGQSGQDEAYGADYAESMRTKFELNYHITFKTGEGIFEDITENDFYEYVGVYYKEDVEDVLSEVADSNYTASDVPDANKMEKRIITYSKDELK